MNIEKLPKWAQEHIRDIQRQRDTAIRELNKHTDSLTPSAFYIDELVCTGEEQGPSAKRRYVEGNKMTVKHCDVELDIVLRDAYIDLQWSPTDYRSGDVAFIPTSYQNAKLISKGNMRS